MRAVAKLIYSAIMSLDGYTVDEQGRFDWSVPDQEVHAFVNRLVESVGIHLYGRRMYETMVAWEDLPLANQPPHIDEFARMWRGVDKVVYSTTLGEVSSARTRIERVFEPETVRRLKDDAGTDLTIGGPHLAYQAIEAGLVDEYHLFVNPVIVGGGTRFLPDRVPIQLELVDQHRFGSGVVFLRYQPTA